MTATLFAPSERLRQVSPNWFETKDSDPDALRLFMRHYSCWRPERKLRGGNNARFSGPGERMVLLSGEADALFVWRRELYRKDDQSGVNCAVFRNEGAVRSSDLIREAMALAWERWPGERLFTHVDARKVKSANPGCCFKKAGWRRCGTTKCLGLMIFEVTPL